MAISCKVVTVRFYFRNTYVNMVHGFVAKSSGGHPSGSSDAGLLTMNQNVKPLSILNIPTYVFG